MHSSLSENNYESNERLEFLGDAILSSIVADYLYRKFPYKDEGYLTEMRSKMVSEQILHRREPEALELPRTLRWQPFEFGERRGEGHGADHTHDLGRDEKKGGARFSQE